MIKKIKNYFLKRRFKEEYQVLDLVKSKFPDFETILEAGGHNGKDSRRIHSLWPKAKLFVFEPEPKLFSQLVENTKDLPNTYTLQLALSEFAGTLSFYISSGKSDASSSLLRPKDHLTAHPDVVFEENTLVETVNMDEWAEKSGVNKIDFMWLDMQGNEYSALKRAPNIISKTKAIYSEVSLIETYEGVILYPEFKKFMQSNGFEVFIEYLTWKDMGNVLFIRRELF